MSYLEMSAERLKVQWQHMQLQITMPKFRTSTAMCLIITQRKRGGKKYFLSWHQPVGTHCYFTIVFFSTSLMLPRVLCKSVMISPPPQSGMWGAVEMIYLHGPSSSHFENWHEEAFRFFLINSGSLRMNHLQRNILWRTWVVKHTHIF